MTTFRLLWEIHKWIGITLGTILVLSAVTGLLLLVKKDYAWIQPPTQRGTAGPPAEIAAIHEVYRTVFALGHEAFTTEEDIARIEFRPSHRIYKVRSEHDDLEIQVDAISLQTWGPEPRRSDWLERLHDGQFFGDWAHGWVMPLAAIGFVFLTLTGYLVWLWPKWLRWRRDKKTARQAT